MNGLLGGIKIKEMLNLRKLFYSKPDVSIIQHTLVAPA